MLIIPKDNPCKLLLPALDKAHLNAVKESLTITNKSALYNLNQFKKKGKWLLNRDPESYQARLDELQSKVKKCLLFETEGTYWTYSGLSSYLSEKVNHPVQNKTIYPSPKPLPWVEIPPFEMYSYQKEIVAKLIAVKHGGIQAACHRRGEKVLMHDGSFKKVEDIEVGNELMGPDSLPRKVLELKNGMDSIYKIETVNGQTLCVNSKHILVLRRTKRKNRSESVIKKNSKRYRGDDPIVSITVEDYLKQTASFKHAYKLYSVPVFFPEKQTKLDPYLLGLILGDGCVFGDSVSITTADIEIEKYIYNSSKSFNTTIKKQYKKNNKSVQLLFSKNKGRYNDLISILKDIGVWGQKSGNKRIPHEFLANSKEVRLKVLAGLIDADGSLSNGCYDFISKSKGLSEDVCYLARSLGMRATIKETKKCDQHKTWGVYWRVVISGHLDQVPVLLPRKKPSPRKQKKDPTSFGFKVTKVSENEEYFGFILDKDHLYLTDSFLVTHNTGLGKTFCIVNIVKQLGLKTLVMAPSTSITEQIYKSFLRYFGKSKVGAYFDGKKDFKKLITIGNAQSLTRIEEGTDAYKALSQIDVFICDESHLAPAETLIKVCFGLAQKAPYRFFFSATQMRNDGLDLLLDAITGPIVFEIALREGVDKGYSSKPIFRFFTTKSNVNCLSDDPNVLTRKHLYYNPKVSKFIGEITNKAVESGMPVLILIDEIEQFTKLLPHLKFPVGFAHGPLNENKEKIPNEYWESDTGKLVEQFNALKTPILVGTSCISTGTDVKAVKFLVYWKGGKSEIEFKQGIGRGTRLFPGKTFCHVIDFDIENVETLHRHAEARRSICNELYGPVRESTF